MDSTKYRQTMLLSIAVTYLNVSGSILNLGLNANNIYSLKSIVKWKFREAIKYKSRFYFRFWADVYPMMYRLIRTWQRDKKRGGGIWRKNPIPESIINNIQIVSWIMATEGYNKTAVSKIHWWFNPATTYLRLYQARIWISKSYVVVTFFLHFFISFCVQRVKVKG